MRNARLRAFKYLLCAAPVAACAQSPALESVPELEDGSTQQIDPSTGIDASLDPMASVDAGEGGHVREPPARDAGADAGDAGTLAGDAAGGQPLVDAGEPGPGAGIDARVDVPDTGPSVPTCAAGTTLCGSACVDLASDPAHCGACGTSCGGTACAASVCAKTVPAGCTTQAYGGHAYLFCTAQLSWIDARDACRKVQLDLVVLDSAAENEFARAAGEAWIGASDIDGETKWRALKPGVASRAEGPLVSYTNWAAGEPSNTLYCAGLAAIGNDCLLAGVVKTDEDCALMRADGRWDDMQCNLLRHYVCESY